MVDARARRWIVLLSALAVTVGAIFYPLDETASPRAERQRRSTTVPVAFQQAAAPVIALTDRVDVDPFAPRGWTAVVEATPVVVAVATAEPQLPIAPPGPPTLPFRFVGRFVDGDSQVVYLSRGDQTLVVRAGETLEGTYKIEEMSARQIQFLHLPTGEKQLLDIPAPEQ